MNTDHGSPPIFNTMYDRGRIISKTPPTTLWYKRTFPVAVAAVMKGRAVASTNMVHNKIRKKMIELSGTVTNHIFNINGQID